jgi:hypothetical protein
MALTEITKIDKIEVTEFNTIQVRVANIIKKDEVEIAKTYQRYVLSPIDDISNQDEKVKAIANAIWTPEVIAAYVELQKENELKGIISAK